MADYAAFGLPPAYLPKDELPHEPVQQTAQATAAAQEDEDEDEEEDEEDHHG